MNTVQSVIIPMLGVGFAQTINTNTPLCNANGTSVQGCNASVPLTGAGANPGLASFRVGVDGSIPTPPAPSAVPSPIVPANGLSEILSFQNDPQFQVGRSHSIDFTIQRSLPGQMIFEAGYIGRIARHLPNSVNFNSAPYMFKDKASGQSFAQAFDAVAVAMRNGKTSADQAWFENQLPGSGVGCGPVDPVTMKPTNISATACLVGGNGAAFLNDNLSNLFLSMDFARLGLGLPEYTNTQVLDLFVRTSRDKSNYNALVLSLRNNSWHGLFFDFNYTFSKSLDTVGAVQNDARYYSSSYNTHLDYGPSFFDRPHVFNAIFDYELPFGKGRRFSSGHSAVNRVIGGWYSAGIFRKSSGVPVLVSISGQPFGGGIIFATPSGMLPTVPVDSLGGGTIHRGVNGSTINTPLGPLSVGTSGDPKNSGTGLNYFADPGAAFQKFRPALIASDTNDGRNSPLRGLGFWNLDMRLGKSTAITERVKVEFSADFFNIFNHPNFLDPASPRFHLGIQNAKGGRNHRSGFDGGAASRILWRTLQR